MLNSESYSWTLLRSRRLLPHNFLRRGAQPTNGAHNVAADVSQLQAERVEEGEGRKLRQRAQEAAGEEDDVVKVDLERPVDEREDEQEQQLQARTQICRSSQDKSMAEG